MARIRTVKPEFWDDEKLATISRDARLTFIGMWNQSDDYGSVKGHLSWLKNKIFPYDEIKPSEFQKWISELEKIQVIFPYEINDEKYFYIRTFATHQTINRPSQFKNPPPPVSLIEHSLNTHGILPSVISKGREVVNSKGEEGIGDSVTAPAIFNLFLKTCKNLPSPNELNKSRQDKIKIRLREHPKIEWWESMFKKADKILIPGKNGKGDWIPTFDWLVDNDKNALKVLEGNYPTRSSPQKDEYEVVNKSSVPKWMGDAVKEGWKI